MAETSSDPAAPNPAVPAAARWFIALKPPAATAAELAAARDALRAAVRDGRPVATRRLHLTLAFLGTGPRDADQIARVQGVLDGVEAPVFDLVLDQMASFNVGRRHVGWIGPRIAPTPLIELVAAIRWRLAATDIDFDARPFVPHVTLLRGLVAPLEPRPVAPIRWPVARVELLASRLDRASYQTLAALDLVAP